MIGTTTWTQLLAAMNLLTGTTGPYHGLTLILFVNNLAPDNDSDISLFTEATFDGYAAVAAQAFGAAYIAGDGEVHATAPTVQFTCTGTTTTQTVYGWGLVNSGKTTWFAGALLPNPVNVTKIGDAIFATPDLALGM